MEPIRIGLMGFGRIGRNLFRILYRRDDLRIAAISDPADHAALEYLLRFDTLLGRFPDEASIEGGHLYVAGRQIPFLDAAEPGDVAWGDLGVDVVIEATAQPRTRAHFDAYLEAGAPRVILCAPPHDPPDVTVVYGVNDGVLRSDHRIVSNASCTAHCAAPILQLLEDAFGIERAFLSSVHAYSNKMRLADVPAEDARRGRAAAENIIPQETNAGAVLTEVLPSLTGRLSAQAVSVPIHNGSLVDLVCWHERPVDVIAINQVVRTAAVLDRWQGILAYEDEPIVSSDIVLRPYSSTFDSLATMVLAERVSKTISWFDSSWGYVHRVVDLVRRLAELDREAAA